MRRSRRSGTARVVRDRGGMSLTNMGATPSATAAGVFLWGGGIPSRRSVPAPEKLDGAGLGRAKHPRLSGGPQEESANFVFPSQSLANKSTYIDLLCSASPDARRSRRAPTDLDATHRVTVAKIAEQLGDSPALRDLRSPRLLLRHASTLS